MFQSESESLYEGHPTCMHQVHTTLAINELQCVMIVKKDELPLH
jgi:hypothetical protein